MRQYIPAIVAGLVAGAVPGGYAVWHKPAPTIVQPQTTILQRSPSLPIQGAPGVSVTMGGVPIVGGPVAGAGLTRAEKRQLAQQWGDLDQKEIDAITSLLLQGVQKVPLTIFCQDDALCGDLQLDFDNAFESAHWETKLERPLIDDTIGVATSSPALRSIINEATSGRFDVKFIDKNAPYEVLVIGKKSGLCHTGKSPGPCPEKK